jgi:hypothetical protein
LIRAYVPSTLPEVVGWYESGLVPAGTRINAVTRALRAQYPDADDEELEFLATKAAEEISTVAAMTSGHRRATLAVDLPAEVAAPVTGADHLHDHHCGCAGCGLGGPFRRRPRVVRDRGDPTSAVTRHDRASDGRIGVMDAVTKIPSIENEPNRLYEPGSPHRVSLQARLAQMGTQGTIDLPMYIDGQWTMGGGSRIKVVQPHAHASTLGVTKNATRKDAAAAVAAAKAAAPAWRAMSYDDRAAIFLKAADLLAGPWRDTLNAATMLGQSKTAFQAEIDSACELIDFWRFNVLFADEILREQPRSSPGVWNQTDHRPLEGFVYAITPFNFTAIAGNLPTAPALMGNVVVWKPAPTQQFAAHYLMQLLEEAGLPPGVINMVTGDGIAVSDVALYDPDLAGSTSPAPHRCSSCCGARSARTSTSTARTRAWWGRPAARTSSWRIPRPTPTCSPPHSSAVPTSSRARSAPRPRGPMSRAASGSR